MPQEFELGAVDLSYMDQFQNTGRPAVVMRTDNTAAVDMGCRVVQPHKADDPWSSFDPHQPNTQPMLIDPELGDSFRMGPECFTPDNMRKVATLTEQIAEALRNRKSADGRPAVPPDLIHKVATTEALRRVAAQVKEAKAVVADPFPAFQTFSQVPPMAGVHVVGQQPPAQPAQARAMPGAVHMGARPASLGAMFQGPAAATKSATPASQLVRVEFDLPGGMQQTSHYDAVIRADASLILVADDRSQGSPAWPNNVSESFFALVPAHGTVYELLSTGIHFTHDHRTYCVCMIQQSREIPAE